MNISKVGRVGCNKYVTNFSRSVFGLKKSSESDLEALKKQDARSSKNENGISVVSMENYDPVSQISVLVKAGSRNETSDNFGITHCLRSISLLSSKNRSGFSLVRNIEVDGGKVLITSSRDFMIYTLQCIRDHMDKAFPLLAEIVSLPAFKAWEVQDHLSRMNVDLAMYKSNPEARLMEALHSVAFRGGLANSLYSPKYMIGKHNVEMLQNYVNENYIGDKTVVAGLGVDHDQLDRSISKLFNMNSNGQGVSASKFSGGEIRIDSDLAFTRTAIVAEGASLSNTKENLSLGVLQCILGVGPYVKHSYGESTKLGEAASKSTSRPFSVSSVNLNYSDTGAFGVYIAGHPDDMKDIVKSVISQMRNITKNLSDADIQIGKHALKTKMLLDLQSSKEVIENMAIQMGTLGSVSSLQELEKSIDDLSAADIKAIACKVMKTKPAMASLGRLHNTPYLDELV